MNLPPEFLHSHRWPAVLDERSQVNAEPAVYALLHQRPFGRLQGECSILYIGSTGQLGGMSDSCRLRIYRYPNGPHATELRRRVQLLVDAGGEVTLRWRHYASKADASEAEGLLLREYESEHGELPPFNGRKEREL
jgi:hypothetical protein